MSSIFKILVVDDEAVVRSAIVKLLASRGYQVSEAENAADALAIATQQEIDLVVLDIELGEDDGLQLLADIKALPRRVGVVMLTGRGYEAPLWEVARKNGADAYLSKALPPSQLLMEIKRWQRRGSASQDKPQ